VQDQREKKYQYDPNGKIIVYLQQLINVNESKGIGFDAKILSIKNNSSILKDNKAADCFY
jgi:hypothetical protein